MNDILESKIIYSGRTSVTFMVKKQDSSITDEEKHQIQTKLGYDPRGYGSGEPLSRLCADNTWECVWSCSGSCD